MARHDRAYGEWHSSKHKGGSKRRKQKIRTTRRATGGSRYKTKVGKRES